ncbi:MAG: rhodanese-like domain-containing protein, partial [Granulosicoccaceae bacterium]
DAEFKRGHMINAMHLPLGQIEKRVNEIAKFKEKPVIAVCESGMRSQRACKSLQKHGFTQLYNLGGGMGAWGKANMPVSTKSK